MHRFPPVQLLVFDLGRVLVRLVRGWDEACALASVPLPAGVADPRVNAALEAAACAHELGRVSNEAFCAHTAALTGLSSAQVEAVGAAWIKGPCPGAAELLAEVRAASNGQRAQRLQTACLSNTNAHHWAIFHRDPALRPLLAGLDYQFASHLIGAMKPDPTVYECVERTIGIAPAGILFFDDDAENVAGASQRGWSAELIDATRDSVPQLREHLRRRGLL